ncbi:MAG TPA: hypothetical protein VJZ00_22050 [Thermoanaerobaculia bacterium]|nr:hypothetical protein [Thermoanaerobaculia bacterium]
MTRLAAVAAILLSLLTTHAFADTADLALRRDFDNAQNPVYAGEFMSMQLTSSIAGRILRATRPSSSICRRA